MKNTLGSSILTIMRIFLLYIGIGLSSIYATPSSGQSKIDIDVEDVSLEELFQEIQSKSEYVFFYKDNALEVNQRVSVRIKKAKLSTILDRAFSKTSLGYKINGKQVVVKKEELPIQKNSDQDKKVEEDPVSGTVLDSDGQPMVGVTIVVRGTTLGTTTDVDGTFTLDAPAGSVLIVSSVGMETQTIEVGNRTTIDVTLADDISQLQELVVVGYSTQTKESLTGSVGLVDGDLLAQVPVSTFEQSLKGNVAGLQATAIDGAPGANTQIRIRGIGSISASSEPLYVIDGIPIQSGSIASNDNDGRSTNVMAAINPNDIESITVLKDAASTAIYGSRGANGVILITTKAGQSGKAVINFKSLTGFSSVASKNILEPLNAEQYTQLFLEGYINRGDTPAEAQQKFDDRFQQLVDPSTGQPTDTDWLDAITRTGVTQSYDLSARGGTDNLKYFFSGGLFDQESFILGSDFKRLSARANLEFKASDRVTISNNISIANMESNTFNDGGSWDNPLKASIELSPLIPIYDDQGRFNGEHTNYFPMAGSNPVGMLSGDDLRETKTLRVIDNFAISVNLVENLTFRSQWNFDLISLREAEYKNPRYGGGSRGLGGTAYNSTILNTNWVGTQTLNYDLELGSDHFVNFLAGYEAQKSISESHSAFGTQFPNDKLKTLNSTSAAFEVGGARSEFTFASVFARVNYDFLGKYFVSSSVRRDGSSRFGAENRWGTFYSFGGGWIVSKESFLDVPAIDLLKLRTSWGVTGNAAIGNFASQGLYTYGQDYDGSPGGRPSQIGNADLTWETQENFNIGLDFEIFSKVSGTIEYFNRISSDLILDVPISRSTGFSSITQNFGEMTNKGLEISLNADVLNINDFSWSVGFNTTILKNEVTNLTEDFIDGVYRREKGQDFQSYYLYGFAGIDADTGQIEWWTDGTKSETTNSVGDAERFLDGKSATPEHFGGFNTSFGYKRFSLNASFTYSYGNYIFDGRARGSLADGRLTPRSTATWAFENRWVPGKTDALLPMHRWGGSPGSGERATSRWLYDGSYIRMRDLTVAYDFPQTLISKLKLSTARAFIRGSNLLTFTKDKDLYMDPEQAISGTYDALTPQSKTISLGLDIGF